MNSALKNLLLEFVNTEDFANVFQKAVDGDYQSFISQLKNWAGDPKVTEFLKSGMKDGIAAEDKFSVSTGFIPCSKLIPTQNEIDLDKSLSYSLKNPEKIKEYLQGGEVVVGGPIITFNGRYIIDGHHRWSQVYAINPNCKIKVVNFRKSGLGPEDMLKATQVAIALTTGDVKVNTVEGHNLLTLSPEQIYKYVLANLPDAGARYLGKTKESAAKKIVYNCRLMQKNNQPIKNAPPRGFMPQTDGHLEGVVKALTSGITQSVAPFTNQKEMATESKKTNKQVLKEWDPSMSMDPSAPFNQSDNEAEIDAVWDLLSKFEPDSEKLQNWFETIGFDLVDKLLTSTDFEKYPAFTSFNRYDSNFRKRKDADSALAKIVAEIIFPQVKAAYDRKDHSNLTETNELNELQTSATLERDEMAAKVSNACLSAGMREVSDNDVYDFVDYNYDLLEPVIDTIDPKILIKNFIEFKNGGPVQPMNNNINESIKKILKEEDSVEAADPVTMFQDFADLTGQLADIYSTLTTYQTSYIQNPQVQQSVAKMMAGVNQLMKMSTSTMSSIGSSFGLQESDLKKKVNESARDQMEGWSAAQWDNFNRLSPIKKMEVMQKLDAPPKGAGKIITAIKTWAKSNYPGWERVMTTPAGKASVIRQYIKTIPAFKDADEAKIKSTVEEVIKIWK